MAIRVQPSFSSKIQATPAVLGFFLVFLLLATSTAAFTAAIEKTDAGILLKVADIKDTDVYQWKGRYANRIDTIHAILTVMDRSGKEIFGQDLGIRYMETGGFSGTYYFGADRAKAGADGKYQFSINPIATPRDVLVNTLGGPSKLVNRAQIRLTVIIEGPTAEFLGKTARAGHTETATIEVRDLYTDDESSVDPNLNPVLAHLDDGSWVISDYKIGNEVLSSYKNNVRLLCTFQKDGAQSNKGYYLAVTAPDDPALNSFTPVRAIRSVQITDDEMRAKLKQAQADGADLLDCVFEFSDRNGHFAFFPTHYHTDRTPAFAVASGQSPAFRELLAEANDGAKPSQPVDGKVVSNDETSPLSATLSGTDVVLTLMPDADMAVSDLSLYLKLQAGDKFVDSDKFSIIVNSIVPDKTFSSLKKDKPAKFVVPVYAFQSAVANDKMKKGENGKFYLQLKLRSNYYSYYYLSLTPDFIAQLKANAFKIIGADLPAPLVSTNEHQKVSKDGKSDFDVRISGSDVLLIFKPKASMDSTHYEAFIGLEKADNPDSKSDQHSTLTSQQEMSAFNLKMVKSKKEVNFKFPVKALADALAKEPFKTGESGKFYIQLNLFKLDASKKVDPDSITEHFARLDEDFVTGLRRGDVKNSGPAPAASPLKAAPAAAGSSTLPNGAVKAGSKQIGTPFSTAKRDVKIRGVELSQFALAAAPDGDGEIKVVQYPKKADPLKCIKVKPAYPDDFATGHKADLDVIYTPATCGACGEGKDAPVLAWFPVPAGNLNYFELTVPISCKADAKFRFSQAKPAESAGKIRAFNSLLTAQNWPQFGSDFATKTYAFDLKDSPIQGPVIEAPVVADGAALKAHVEAVGGLFQAPASLPATEKAPAKGGPKK